MSTITSVSEQPVAERQKDGALSPSVLVAIGVTLAAVFFGVLLRWIHLGGLSLWFDEGQTEFAASLSPANVIRLVQSADHPPLYFLLQHYWGIVFGNSEYSLRALAALFGTLSLPVFYLLARKILKDGMAVALAMWLFAFSMVHLWYSREARAYEATSFLSLVGLYALLLLLEKRSILLFAVIVLSATANLYMHNMMLFYLMALNVVWLTYPSDRGWIERFKESLLADVIVGVFYLAWVPSLLAQAKVDITHHLFWAPRPTLGTVLGTLTLLGGFNLEYLSWLPTRFLGLSPTSSGLVVAAGVILCVMASLIAGFWRTSKTDRIRYVSLVLYCLAPILAVYVLSQVMTPVFIDRVFISSSIVLPILFAYPLAVRKGLNARIVCGTLGVTLGILTSLSGFGFVRYQDKDDWRGATNSLLRIQSGDRLVVFIARMGEPLFDYYAQRSAIPHPVLAQMGLPRDPLKQFPPPPGGKIYPSDLDQLKRAVESGKYSEIDLVLASERHDDPDEMTLTYLSQTWVQAGEQSLTGIRIIRFIPPARKNSAP